MQWTYLFGILAVLTAAAEGAPKLYKGYATFNIDAATDEEQEDLDDVLQQYSDIDVWVKGKPGQKSTTVLVSPETIDELEADLAAAGLEYTNNGDKVLQKIEKEAARLEKKYGGGGGDPPAPFDIDDFNPFEVIMSYLDTLNDTCASNTNMQCSIENRGTTYDGNDIKLFKISRDEPDREVCVFDSTIHAREWLTTATILKMMRKMVYEPTDPEVTDLLNKCDFYFIPVVNPDGYIYTATDRLWRKNRRPTSNKKCPGVDLNRNFDIAWTNTGADPCTLTYPGASAASELETQVLQTLAEENASRLKLWVTMHAYTQMWLHSWGTRNADGSCMTGPNDEVWNRVARAAADASEEVRGPTYEYESGGICSTIYPVSGSTTDYISTVSPQSMSLAVELAGGNFTPDPSEIEPSHQEFWAAVNAIMDDPDV